MKLRSTAALLMILLLFTTSCVSKRKYTDMQSVKNQLQGMLDSRNDEINKLRGEAAAMQKSLKDCEDARKRLEQDTLRMATANSKLLVDIKELKTSCDQLNANYQQLKAKSSEKMKDMLEQLEALQRDLQQREKRLAEVESKLQERDSVMNALQKRLADALLGFKDDGLTVEIKNGKVYVSLSNKLLFASGSTKIDANGQKALIGLANVLKGQNDLTVMVEGHTDDVPVSNLGAIKDNWDLSVMRSTEVVRLLVANGVSPMRIIPAGRGEFIPKTAGATTEARANNRRTEIIISPKLDELYDLISNQR